MITEPKQVNAGIPQGAFLKRHVVLKPDGTPFVPDDFCIGCDTGIYGRQIRIYDCDDYTRKYYQVRLITTLILCTLPNCQAKHPAVQSTDLGESARLFEPRFALQISLAGSESWGKFSSKCCFMPRQNQSLRYSFDDCPLTGFDQKRQNELILTGS